MTTTAWGRAQVIEEIAIKQSAAGHAEGVTREFTTLVQLLEGSEGEVMVRFAYATDGTARRGPVTLRAPDLSKLRKALSRTPRLKRALGIT